MESTKKFFYVKISESKSTFETKSFTELITEHLMKFKREIDEHFLSLGKDEFAYI